MDDEVRALLSPEGEAEYLRQREIADADLAELRRRLAPDLKERGQPKKAYIKENDVSLKQHGTSNAYAIKVWRLVEDFSNIVGAELAKAESRTNAKIKTLEADVAALRAEIEILRQHKVSKPSAEGSITSLRGRSVAA